ncbi:MAG: amidohydrolase family protein, partial [Burkholderiales bacterium]
MDTILVNGKIVTVDDRFTIAQALAIKNQRVVATGSNADIRKLAGANTKVIDAKGRTVIPGLIDNHSHWIRAAEHDELRFDGVTSRKQALAMLAERVRTARPGEWVSVLGGWSEEQFTDDARGFPLAELDKLAPDTPLAIQSIYNHTWLNTAGLRAAKIDESTPNPPNGAIEKDASGKLTGLVRGAGGVAFVAGKVPKLEAEARMNNVRKLATYLNSLGITGWGDAGGRGMSAGHYAPYRELADKGELTVRVFWTTIRQPSTPEQVDKVLAEVATVKPFQGNDYMDHIGWGESVFAPITTQLLRAQKAVNPDGVKQMQRIATALAQRGVYLNAHVEMNGPINQFLDAYEEISTVAPIRGLRWSLSHLDQIDEAQLQRMKRLGLNAQIHSRPLIQGVLMHKVHG